VRIRQNSPHQASSSEIGTHREHRTSTAISTCFGRVNFAIVTQNLVWVWVLVKHLKGSQDRERNCRYINNECPCQMTFDLNLLLLVSTSSIQQDIFSQLVGSRYTCCSIHTDKEFQYLLFSDQSTPSSTTATTSSLAPNPTIHNPSFSHDRYSSYRINTRLSRYTTNQKTPPS